MRVSLSSPSTVLLGFLVLGAGCSDDGDGAGECEVAVPGMYVSADYDRNAAVELALRAKLADLSKKMKSAEDDLSVKPPAAELKTLFSAGGPSLRSTATPAFVTRVEALLDWFAAAAGATWMPADPPPANGGKYGPNIFTKEGVDIRQVVEKGTFAGVFYNHALSLMMGTVTEATIDRLVAAIGAHPSFPADDKAPMNPDVQVALYAKRRTNKEAATPGIYFQIRDTLIAAKATAAGGAQCKAALDGALRSFRDNWEKTELATVLFYANDAKNKLLAQPPTEAGTAGGLHGIGEAVGFLEGFRMIPQTNRRITEAQLEELLTLFGVPPNAAATTYKFATDTANELPKLDQVIGKIQMIYGLSAEEVAEFKISR